MARRKSSIHPIFLFFYTIHSFTSKENSSSDPEMQNPHRDTDDSAIIRENPNVQWDDVVGLDGPKAALKEAVILRLKFPHLVTGVRRSHTEILLYGPPGTGKSYLAKAVATEAKITFFSISASDLLFRLARESKPSIILIDEIHALMSEVWYDSGIRVLGATNFPWQLDNVIGRLFSKPIYIPLPDVDARQRMFERHAGTTPCQLTPQDYPVLAENTEGYLGSHIVSVAQDALTQPARKVLSATHFKRIPVPDFDHPDRFKWTPCSSEDLSAKEKSWETIDADELLEPPLKLTDFMKSVERNKSTCSAEDVKRCDD
ncbi:P-loop containing nucleoside triphosphate hydrolase protein [Gymnopus androsaceus JB14]|uniref:P-loop containing nucleoside triphosphate hydrolase protein n=1 Tax=Gymnopus androsaceus JB14 TaxID=1447944 RepID=A0A6A4HHD1_9AGAR|nr:P-loop containing nucleoside triphosphate hydrolase protein [Gymnopus androsaceus JB14]